MWRCRTLAVRSVTTLPGGDCSWTWAALGHAIGVVEPHPQSGHGPGYAVDPVASARVANSGTG